MLSQRRFYLFNAFFFVQTDCLVIGIYPIKVLSLAIAFWMLIKNVDMRWLMANTAMSIKATRKFFDSHKYEIGRFSQTNNFQWRKEPFTLFESAPCPTSHLKNSKRSSINLVNEQISESPWDVFLSGEFVCDLINQILKVDVIVNVIPLKVWGFVKNLKTIPKFEIFGSDTFFFGFWIMFFRFHYLRSSMSSIMRNQGPIITLIH